LILQVNSQITTSTCPVGYRTYEITTAANPTDGERDADSQMLSSPSESSENMFPNDDPPTPTNIEHAAMTQIRGAEMSPPPSQDEQNLFSQTQGEDMMDVSSSRTEDASRDAAQKADEAEKNEPGWGWSNSKAMEEYRKAMEGVTDKGFSLSMKVYSSLPNPTHINRRVRRSI
jgi:hypothetical protein